MTKEQLQIGTTIYQETKRVYCEAVIFKIEEKTEETYYYIAYWKHFKKKLLKKYEMNVDILPFGFLKLHYVVSSVSHFCRIDKLFDFFSQYKDIYFLGLNDMHTPETYSYNGAIVIANIAYLKADDRYFEIFASPLWQNQKNYTCPFVWIENSYDVESLHLTIANYNYIHMNNAFKCDLVNLAEQDETYMDYFIGKRYIVDGVAFCINDKPVLSIMNKPEYVTGYYDGLISVFQNLIYYSSFTSFCSRLHVKPSSHN